MQQQLWNCDSWFLLHIDLEQAIAMVTALAFPPEEKSRTYLQHALLLSIFDSQRIAAEEQQTFLCSSYAQTKRLASNPAEPSPFLPNSWLPSTPHCSNRALASWHFPPIVFFRVTHKPAAAAALHGQDHINIPMSMPPACPGSPWQLLLTHAAAPAFTHLVLLSPLFCGWQMAPFSSNLQGVVRDGFLPSLHCPFPHSTDAVPFNVRELILRCKQFSHKLTPWPAAGGHWQMRSAVIYCWLYKHLKVFKEVSATPLQTSLPHPLLFGKHMLCPKKPFAESGNLGPEEGVHPQIREQLFPFMTIGSWLKNPPLTSSCSTIVQAEKCQTIYCFRDLSQHLKLHWETQGQPVQLPT